MNVMSQIKEQIECSISEYCQDNMPDKLTPIRDGDFLYVFGEVYGVVVYPTPLHESLMFTIIMEDDENWFVPEFKEFEYSSVTWIPSLTNCLKVAQEYLKEHASVLYFKNTDVPCGYQLPWK